MNLLLVEGIRALGLTNDGSIDASDLRALGAWARADAGRYETFAALYGTSRNGVETGFQLVEQDGSDARLWGEGAVNEVADAIYSFGFGDRDGRLLDVNGDLYRSVALTASWLDRLLSDADMKALSNPDVVIEGTTGTGLDRPDRYHRYRSGPPPQRLAADIVEGAKAADALNHMILDGIREMGLANDGTFDKADIISPSTNGLAAMLGRLATYMDLQRGLAAGSITRPPISTFRWRQPTASIRMSAMS